MMGNERGQYTLEGILLMVVFVGIILLVARFFKTQNVIANMVEKPWAVLAGMLENGEWMTPDKGQSRHPSQHGRHVTIEGAKP